MVKDKISQWIESYLYRCGLILFFGKPDPPAPPDYRGAAIAQGENNLETARLQGRLNNPNMFTPYGSQTVDFGEGVFDQEGYDRDLTAYNERQSGVPGNNQWDLGGNNRLRTFRGRAPNREDYFSEGTDQPTITQTLSDSEQGIFDANQRIKQSMLDTGEAGLERIDESMGTPWDTSGAPGVTAYADMDNTNEVAEALRARYMPDLLERRQQGMNDLLVQGHTRGGTAWDTAGRDFDRTENDFNMAAIIQAENEKRAADAAQHSIESSDRGRFIGEQAYDRNVPLNEVNSLRTGNQVTPYQYQGYNPTSIQPAPLFDATLASGNFAQQNFANEASQYWNPLEGAVNIGAAWAGRPIWGAPD